MAMTLTGFVYDNAGNAISGATVQGYVSADDQTSGTTAEASTTTNSDGKWSITTSTAARIPMDVLITYGSNKRWIKAGDKVNVTDMTVTGTLTVGEDAAGFDFSLFSSDTSGDGLTWDASEEVLQITGKDANTALDVLDGDVRIVDKLYFYDRGGEYLSSDGSTLTITGAVTIGALSLSSMSSNWTNASRTVADMGIVTTIDINGGTIDGAVIGGASAAAVTGTAVTGTSLVGGTVAGTTGTFSSVVDVTDTTDSSDATGDTGALRTEGGASIAKKLYVGTDVSVGNDLTVAGDLTVSGDTITVNTATLAVEDPLIALATGNDSADALDIGIYGLYDTSGSQDEYSGLFRDATDEKWKLFQDLQVAPTTTVNTGGAGYAVGTLVATLEGNVTGALTGNADTVTTNANLTGHVTSTGNAAVLGSFTKSQLSTAVSDGTPLYSGDVGTYTAGDGLDVTGGGEFSTDLKANGGLEISSTELSVAQGISQYDVAQFAASVADNDFLRIDGTAVEGLSASEVAAAIEGSIDAVGTIASGTWQGTAIASGYIADNAITLAKMAGGTDGNIISYDASGDPVAIATGNDGQVLTSAGAGAPPAFEDAAGGGGIDTAEQWRVSTDQAIDSTISGGNGAVIDNWERNDTTGSGAILDGSGITVSSGVFTFPSTGIWMVQMIPQYTGAGGPGIVLETCDDYSTGPTWAAQFYRSLDTAFSYSILYNAWLIPTLFFDVTDVDEDKLQFLVGSAGSNGTLKGDSAGNETVAYFIRLGDT